MGLFKNREGGLMDVIRVTKKNILYGNGVRKDKILIQRELKTLFATDLLCVLKREKLLCFFIKVKMETNMIL